MKKEAVKKRRKRLNLSIKKGMQFRLIYRIFLIILIAVLLSALIFLFGSQKKVASTFQQFHVQLRNFRDLILPLAIAGMIIGLIGALIMAFFFPKHLAGPLYRIENTIEDIAEGDLSDSPLHLRPGDELKKLASQITKMRGEMRNRVFLLKETHERIGMIHGRIADAIKTSDIGHMKEDLASLQDEIKRAKDIIDEFKV